MTSKDGYLPPSGGALLTVALAFTGPCGRSGRDRNLPAMATRRQQ